VFVKYPDECCPKSCSSKCPSLLTIFDDTLAGRVFWKMRCYTYVLVEHNYFETFIIAMIITSSLALVFNFISILSVQLSISCRGALDPYPKAATWSLKSPKVLF